MKAVSWHHCTWHSRQGCPVMRPCITKEQGKEGRLYSSRQGLFPPNHPNRHCVPPSAKATVIDRSLLHVIPPQTAQTSLDLHQQGTVHDPSLPTHFPLCYYSMNSPTKVQLYHGCDEETSLALLKQQNQPTKHHPRILF